MQWPDARKHRETEEQHGKCPRLQARTKVELRQLIQIQRSGGRISNKDSGENEHSTEERVERQIHRAVLLVGRTKDGDKKIFRHNHQFVECEEQKQIGAEKNAVTTSYDQQQPEEKFALTMVDIPRKQHGAYGGDARDKNHREADAINSEMVIHPQQWHPRHTYERCEVSEIRNWRANKFNNSQDKAGDCRNQRYPTRRRTRQKQQHDCTRER